MSEPAARGAADQQNRRQARPQGAPVGVNPMCMTLESQDA